MLLTMCLLLLRLLSFYTAPASSFWVMTIDAATIAVGTTGEQRGRSPVRSRMPPGDASERRAVADIEPDGMSAPPRAATEHPTRYYAVRQEPLDSEETPAHVPTARPSCQGLSAQPPSGRPQSGRPHGQTVAPSKPSVFQPDAELAAKLAARLDGTAASQPSEEPAKPRATFSPEQLRLLQVMG